MAIALVRAGAVTSPGAGTTSPAFGQATTAGNLLVATVSANATAAITTTSSGWTQAVAMASTACGSAVFYKPNCGASELAPLFTCVGATAVVAQVSEWSGAATSPLDCTGTASGSSKSLTVTASAADVGTGELSILASTWIVNQTGETFTNTCNNGTATSLGASTGQTSVNADYGYALTTANASRDSWTISSSLTNNKVSANCAAIASFLPYGGVLHTSSLAGSAAFVGASSRGTQRALSASGATIGGLARQPQRAFVAIASTAGSLGRRVGRKIAATLSVAGAATSTHLHFLALLATVSPQANGPQRTVRRLLPAAVSPTATATRLTSRVLAGTTSLGGTLSNARAFLKALAAAAVTPSGSIQRQNRVVLSSAGSFVGLIERGVSRSLASALAFTSSTVRLSGRLFNASVSFAGAAAIRTLRIVSGALPPTASLSRKSARTITALLSPSGTRNAAMSRGVTSVLTSSGVVGRATSRAVRGVLDSTGAIRRGLSRVMSSATSTVGGLTRSTARGLAALLTSSGAPLFAQRIRLVVLSSSLTSGAVVSRHVSRTVVAVVAVGGTFVRTTLRGLTGMVGFVAQNEALRPMRLLADIAFSGALSTKLRSLLSRNTELIGSQFRRSAGHGSSLTGTPRTRRTSNKK